MADAARCKLRTVRCVVYRARSLVGAAEQDRGILAVDAEHAQSQPAARRQRVGHVAKEPLGIGGHELGLFAARPAMERDEPVRHRGALALLAETKRDPAAGLEAAELSAELVALLLSKALHVCV